MRKLRTAQAQTVLDPGSSLVEVLVALVLALGLVTGVRAGLLGNPTPPTTAALMLLTAVVWGVIDGGLHLVGVKLHYGHLDQVARDLRTPVDRSPQQRRAMVAGAFGDLESAGPPHLIARAHDNLADALAAGPTSRRLTRQDWIGALALLGWSVFVTGVVAIPLLLPLQPGIALGAAQILGMGLLFVAGHLWARHTRYHRLGAGLALAAVGALMILFTVAFGVV